MQAIEKQASAESAEVNQFATVLVFKQRSKGEARSALAALRSSDDDVSSAEVDGLARKLQAEEVGGALRIGDCALRDPDSRVAVVTIDQMFHVLQRAAQTNPKLKAVDWAEPVPADPQDWEINPEALLRVRTNVAAIAGPVVNPDDVPDDEDPEVAAGDEDLEELEDNRDWTETQDDVGSR
jgi:hypothetical protein